MRCKPALATLAVLLLCSGCGLLGGESVASPVTLTAQACTPSKGEEVRLVPVADALRRPVLLTAPPGDDRLFVVEQPGRIRILGADRTQHSTFLDIRRVVETAGSEQGLLGLAFHPDYARNGRLFVSFNEAGTGETVLSQFTVSADKAVANPTEKRVFTLKQPYQNHNGGHIAFGPDGLLYLGLGDGGAGGDPKGHGQNRETLLGAMLRFDVDADPSTPEMVAMGLRNPWRWSFDRANGDLWIGDVGQTGYEEIDRIPSGSVGLNFGWNTREGNHCYGPGPCDTAGFTAPVIDVSRTGGCDSITGGYVYRGSCLPDLAGTYVYGDYCDNWVRSLRLSEEGKATAERDLTADLGASVQGLSSFGEDAAGELYVLSHRDGVVYKLVGR